LVLAASYGALGKEEEAQSTVKELLKLNPRFSLERFAKQMLYRGAAKERFLYNCRKPGLE
jgi:hypothetical protein